jgi:hypothetical protein
MHSMLTSTVVQQQQTWLKPSEWANPLAIVDIRDVHNLRTFFVGIVRVLNLRLVGL